VIDEAGVMADPRVGVAVAHLAVTLGLLVLALLLARGSLLVRLVRRRAGGALRRDALAGDADAIATFLDELDVQSPRKREMPIGPRISMQPCVISRTAAPVFALATEASSLLG